MSHTSPTSYLVWSIVLGLLYSFFFFHLWRFDKFRCLKWWQSNAYSGAFKRVMTYSYLLTVPLILTYAVGNAVIKYKEGLIPVPGFGVVPKPWQLWSEAHQKLIIPFQFIFAVGWSFEIVTHLEELCFWLYLINPGTSRQNWFKSPYFRTWIIGASIAIIYMPIVTAFTRHDPLRCEAFTFLAGGLGSLCLTIWFLPILWVFPGFLRDLKRDNVDQNTIIRLTKFHELNTIRVVFRFIMTVPIVILGADGARPHVHINTSYFWTDFLVILSSFGCAVSSGITLTIFFPRSIEAEMNARESKKERKRIRRFGPDSAGGTYTGYGGDRSSIYSYSFSGSQAGITIAPTGNLSATDLRQTQSPGLHGRQHSFTGKSIDSQNANVRPGFGLGGQEPQMQALPPHYATSRSPVPGDIKWETGDVDEAEPTMEDSADMTLTEHVSTPRAMTRPTKPLLSGTRVGFGDRTYLTERNLSRHDDGHGPEVQERGRTRFSTRRLNNFRSPIDMGYEETSGSRSDGEEMGHYRRRRLSQV